MNNQSERLAVWHRVVFEQDGAGLEALLAPDVRFRSPFFWKAKEGPAIAGAILRAATTVFSDFTYQFFMRRRAPRRMKSGTQISQKQQIFADF